MRYGALILISILWTACTLEETVSPGGDDVSSDTLGDTHSSDTTTGVDTSLSDTGAPSDTTTAQDTGGTDTAIAGDTGISDTGSTDTGSSDVSTCPDPVGSPCNPIPIDSFPYTDSRDTSQGPATAIDAYSCSPSTNESGPEFYYSLNVTGPGILTAWVDDVSGDSVDVDLHLLGSASGDDCLERDNVLISAELDAGNYVIVADTWVNSSGDALSGPYTLEVRWLPIPVVNCAVETRDLRMFWTSCASGIDCYESGGEYFLRTPTTGPVVKEAHLVTEAEDFGGGWPTSFTHQIDRHYDLSESASGYVMIRSEPWAPAGEGGSEYGQGSTGAPLPLLDEAWYVNMYWRDRPARGTRMIISHPTTGRTVVASAGYETGPGANTRIGGAVEEIHHHLGTSHLDDMTFGFAVDQSLPLGPVRCQ